MLKVYRRTKTAKLPTKAHKGDAGWDLYVDSDKSIFIEANSDAQLSTGISIVIGEDEVAFIRDKSGVSTKQMVSVEAGVVDSSYAGEIIVVLHNRSGRFQTIQPGQKIAQIIVMKCDTSVEVEELTELPDTTRGDGGFGSTGIF